MVQAWPRGQLLPRGWVGGGERHPDPPGPSSPGDKSLNLQGVGGGDRGGGGEISTDGEGNRKTLALGERWEQGEGHTPGTPGHRVRPRLRLTLNN